MYRTNDSGTAGYYCTNVTCTVDSSRDVLYDEVDNRLLVPSQQESYWLESMLTDENTFNYYDEEFDFKGSYVAVDLDFTYSISLIGIDSVIRQIPKSLLSNCLLAYEVCIDCYVCCLDQLKLISPNCRICLELTCSMKSSKV